MSAVTDSNEGTIGTASFLISFPFIVCVFSTRFQVFYVQFFIFHFYANCIYLYLLH